MRYAHIVFVQGSDFDEASDWAEASTNRGHGTDNASWAEGMVEYLSQWESWEEEESDTLGNGSADNITHVGDYVLTYNRHQGYAALARVLEDGE